MKISEITSFLESIAPLSLQESYDNAGLITGNKHNDVTGVLLCLDCIESVVDEAIEIGCNLIIAHHPIIFSGLKKLTGASYIERTIIKAIKNDIAIYAIHTNYDNIFDGVNAMIAQKLGLKDCKILSPKKNFLKKLVVYVPFDQADAVRTALFNAGAGTIGHYDHCSFNTSGIGTFKAGEQAKPFVGEKGVEHHEDEIKIETIYPAYAEADILTALRTAHPYEEVAYDLYSLDNAFEKIGAGLIGFVPEINALEFLTQVKGIMKAQCIKHTALPNKPITKVAICGGAGFFLLPVAIAAKADIFITSDIKYHQYFDADGKILLADIGHYESEQFTIDKLAELLQKKFSNFALHFTKINTNPVKYL